MAQQRQYIRGTHPYAFRSGQWANLIMVVPARGRDCFLVAFPDGETDLWPCTDPSEPYEFAQGPYAPSDR